MSTESVVSSCSSPSNTVRQQLSAAHRKYMDSLRRLGEHCRAETEKNLESVTKQFGLTAPVPSCVDNGVDLAKVEVLTQLAHVSGSNLSDFVRLIRGQTAADPRPNKDLYELREPPTPALHEAWRRWNEVVAHGVVPEWLYQRPSRQETRPPNHRSIEKHMPRIWRHIRKGQDDGRYLVVKATMLQQWVEIFVSPVGVVDKVGAEGPDIRIIDDYSFPDDASINDFTDRSHLPKISYNPPRDIAKRILNPRRKYPHSRILLMLGDVAGAFRHVPIHADHVHMFALVIGDLLVIDLACGFGWCGSPAWYFIPGELINGLYERGLPTIATDPPLVESFWCDDHTCVEVDEGCRCFVAELALRRAMTTVLGPTAINERKFTAWSEAGRALGLLWNTSRGDVTIPLEKIEKARQRVKQLLAARAATKRTLLQLLGSLRQSWSVVHPLALFSSGYKIWQRL